jgi:maleylacetoacetate isomerase
MSGQQVDGTTDVSLRLFTYYRSSCSGRLRIALALKRIPYTSTYINLIANSQHETNYTSINPSHSVPTVEVTTGDSTFRITQSVAALEYLEEAFPNTIRLLPPLSSTQARATVRTLVEIIAADIQPPTNLRIINRVRKSATAAQEDPTEAVNRWVKEIVTEGLLSYETICKNVAGKYSVGDDISMADCCLVPAIWGAERFGVTLDQMPTVKRIYEELSQMEEVMRSHWKNQEDTPEGLRH